MRTGDRRLAMSPAGYAMVALLVGLNVMAIMMAMALPVWHQMAQREREAELIFRGEQYERAIALYQRRNGPGTLPPDIPTLIEGRFLRKAYKDPITGDDFVLIRQGTAADGNVGEQPPLQRESAEEPRVTTVQGGGVVGVVSSSDASSVRIYKGQTAYNEWRFVFAQADAPGSDGVGRGQGSLDNRGDDDADSPNDNGARGRGEGRAGGRGQGGAGAGPDTGDGRGLPRR